jgi:hypothetical protein
MILYDALQWAIIGGAALASAAYMLGRLAPGLRAKLGAALSKSDYPRWVNAAAAKLAGPAGAGCGSGCSSCNSCGSTRSTAKQDLIKTVQ